MSLQFSEISLPVFAMATTLVIAPRLAAETVTNNCIADTALRSNVPDNNLGGMTYVPVGTGTEGVRNHGLFKFDAAATVPAGATITGARLRFFVSGGSSLVLAQHHLYRMLVDWGEGNNVGGPSFGNVGSPADAGEATWNNRFHPSTAWSIGGGGSGVDYAAVPSASANLGAAGSSAIFTSSGMVADVQAWLDDPATNFGWLLVIADENNLATGRQIASREAPGGPILEIDFTTSSGAPVISSPTISNGSIQFTFEAAAGNLYTVESRPLPGVENWMVLTNFAALGVDTRLTVTDPLTPSNRIYRIRTP